MISKKRKLELLISIKHFFIKEQRYAIACLIRDEEREIGIDNSVKYIEAGHQGTKRPPIQLNSFSEVEYICSIINKYRKSIGEEKADFSLEIFALKSLIRSLKIGDIGIW